MTMNFKDSKNEALKQLDFFLNDKIKEYSQKRNFDYGPNKRENVSCLSPYFTHRLINEYDTIKKVLDKYSYIEVEKFIQEIFWRIYWKGWLEQRPKVWSDFLSDLKEINQDSNYLKAINGETNINCFNDWVRELKENNYLHNHSRMWFASIWIFTLKLPWQKGAEFFMKYLLDGDAASNTLSWRWVAGLQTKGKNYLAKSFNISKFTNNRYNNTKLIEDAIPLKDKRDYKPKKIELSDKIDNYENLIVFENDLDIEKIKFSKYNQIHFVLLKNDERYLKLDDKVIKFKRKLLESKFSLVENKNGVLSGNQLRSFLENQKFFHVVYPSVGENLTFLKKLTKEKNLEVSYIIKPEDQYCWQFSDKGYFNFKSNIPKILSHLKLN